MSMSYSPTIPTKLYTAQTLLQIKAASLTLDDLVCGGKNAKYPVTPPCRTRRHQVGSTNRWRLSRAQGSDLLGCGQATKANQIAANESMRRCLTAENPNMLGGHLTVKSPDSMRGIGGPRPKSAPASQYSQSQSNELSINTLRPPSSHRDRPHQVLAYHSKRTSSKLAPDVLLRCLGTNWELHHTFIIKSQTLAILCDGGSLPSPKRYYRKKVSQKLDELIEKNSFYSAEYKQGTDGTKVEDVDETKGRGVSHPKHVSEQRVANMTVISLDVTDPLITQHALAVALGNLYHEDVVVDVQDVVGVHAAAHLLDCHLLAEGCAKIMMTSIKCRTVCGYHDVASRYDQEDVYIACERWLELNLVPKLALEIQLKYLPMDLLEKTVKSNRLFTLNEYALYRMLAYWTFLQLNPGVQLMPSYSSVITYFTSRPKSTCLLMSEEGTHFAHIFTALRMHGVTDITNFRDIQTMNILPQEALIQILSAHYHALQEGGDMWLLTNFNTHAVRQGFVLNYEPQYHSEVLSLHGFHFELKAVKESKPGTYSFYMKRLKPADPILSFWQSQRHTFSMRQERAVRYSIMAQYIDENKQCRSTSTGMLTQHFGITSANNKSQVLTIDSAVTPLHISFAVLFPGV